MGRDMETTMKKKAFHRWAIESFIYGKSIYKLGEPND